MNNEQIKEAQKACLNLIKTLELSKKGKDIDKIYTDLKKNLQDVNIIIDKIFDDIIFSKEE